MNGVNITLRDAAAMLAEKDNILILCHIRPDGDTLGSGYGLKYALEALGKKAKVLCGDGIPSRLTFIGEAEQLEEGEDFEFVCAVDAAETHMLGVYGEKYADRIDLKIDHHPTGALYAKANHIDGTASATGELIYRITEYLEEITGQKCLTPKGASALYAAVTSDTGCFRYSNTTSDTMRIAGALIDGGADNFGVCFKLFSLKSRSELNAQKCMLDRIEFHQDGRLATALFTNSDKESYGVTDEDFGGLVSDMREIEGVELAITIRQDSKEPSKFKVSMRSSENVNSSDLCAIFGGGGHARAAGCSVSASSPEDAERIILKGVIPYFS